MSPATLNPVTMGDILVVDDNISDLKFLSGILKQAGHTVRPASDTELALHSIRARLPDLILMDINMPNLDGYEVCRRLKNSEDTRDIPVIFVSARASSLDKVKAFGVGGVDYIVKPFEVEEVMARVAMHLALWNSQKKIEERNLQLQQEISERKQAEQALWESESFLKDVFNAIGDGISVLDRNLKIIRVNSWMEKMYSQEAKIVGRKCYEVYQTRDAPCPWCPCLKTMETGKVHHAIVPYPSEKDPTGWIDLSSFPLKNAEGDVVGVIEYLKDITELKKVEEMLRKSEKKYRTLLETTSEGFWMLDSELKIMEVNESLCKMLGYRADEMIGKTTFEFVDDENRKIFIKQTSKIPDTAHRTYEITLKKKNGQNLHAYFNSTTPRNEFSEVQCSFAFITDITKSKQAEKLLRENEARYRTMTDDVLDSSFVGVFILDSNFQVVWVNQALERYFGLRRKEIIGKDKRQLIRERIRNIFENSERFVEKVFATYDNNTYIEHFECHVLPGDDREERWLEHWSQPIRYGLYAGGRIEHYSDITMLKREEEGKIKLQAQLQQAQKMEAIGTIASGIAHDFNNILTVITAYADLALMNVGKEGTLREEIEEIQMAGERGSSLTRQLLAFSRKQIIQPEVLDLNELLTDLEKMLGRLIVEDIELLMIPGPGLRQVEVDLGQIEQVMMNLVVNARDAMPMGGKLILETTNVDLDEGYFQVHGIEAHTGPYVMLSVSDTGSGMDKETQERIFEPFFTTKEIGKGTGLGLSTVYGIVKQSNGFIWVYSEPGQGTTFKVYLPKAKEGAKPKEKEQPPVEDLGGSEVVLIVEDDDMLRKLAHKILRQRGYKVLTAEDGEDALRISKEHEGSIDLMITDVVMPKISGKETAERMQALYPHMKVIFMSGYTDNVINHHGVLTPELNFIEKPFTSKGLARKVREVLDN